MSANADPEERPLAGDGGDHGSFDSLAAEMAEPKPVDEFGDLDSDPLTLDPDESAPAETAETATGLRAHEVQFIADLAQMASGRAAEEARIEADYQAAVAEAAQAAEQARQDFATWLVTEEQAIAADRVAAGQAADKRLERDTAANDRGFAELKQKLEAEFQPARQAAAKGLADARAAADKQFDSRKHLAPRKLEEFQKQLEAWKVRITSDRDQAVKLLKTCASRRRKSRPTRFPVWPPPANWPRGCSSGSSSSPPSWRHSAG